MPNPFSHNNESRIAGKCHLFWFATSYVFTLDYDTAALFDWPERLCHSPGFSRHIQPFYAEVSINKLYVKNEDIKTKKDRKIFSMFLFIYVWDIVLSNFLMSQFFPDPTLLEFQNSLPVSRSSSFRIMCFQRQEYHVILNPKVHPIDLFPEASPRNHIAQSFLTKVSNAQRK